MVDDTAALTGTSLPSGALYWVSPMVSRADLARAAGWYLGDLPATDPRASPLFADLSGLPPLAIFVGSDEVLLDDVAEGLVVAERLMNLSHFDAHGVIPLPS